MADDEMDFSTKNQEKERILGANSPDDGQEEKMEDDLDDSDDSSDDEQAESGEITALRQFVSEMTTHNRTCLNRLTTCSLVL